MNAGQQFPRVEGFGQVIVSADLQPDDAVHVFAFGRQHDDGCAVIGRAQTPADRQAVLARHHQVQHDQVHRVAHHDAVQGFAVFGQDDLKAFLRQITAQQVPDAGIVVQDQDFVSALVCLCHDI